MSDQSYDLLRANQKAHDKRAMWERPAVHRLAANNAEGGSSNLDDGNCTGTGNDFHHSCKSSDIRLKHEIVRVGILFGSYSDGLRPIPLEGCRTSCPSLRGGLDQDVFPVHSLAT